MRGKMTRHIISIKFGMVSKRALFGSRLLVTVGDEEESK